LEAAWTRHPGSAIVTVLLPLLRTLALLCVIAAALQSAAQVSVESVVPAAPTSADIIFANISVPAHCDENFTTVITGNAVRTDVVISGCMGGPQFDLPREEQFGPLAPGTYSYEVYLRTEDEPTPQLIYAQTITVSPAIAAAAVPTLTLSELILLGAALVTAALFSLRRTG
jgi:hypothetical protein